MIRNGCKTYSNIIAKIHKLLQTLTNLDKLIKIQWIPSHVIPENDIADKMAKMAYNWHTISEFLSEYEENVCNLRRYLHSYRLDNWEQAKSFFKVRGLYR